MDNNSKANGLEVGTKLYRYKSSRYTEPEIIEYTVSKIGKKYFELKEINGSRFFIENLRYDAGAYSNSSWQLYKTAQEILDEKEFDKLYSSLCRHFSHYTNRSRNTLEQLRQIAEVLGLKTVGK